MMILITSACVCFLCFLMFMVCFRKNTAEPPALPGKLPILGHLHRILLNDMIIFLRDIATETAKSGGVSVLGLGIRKICVVTDPEDCLTVANACLDKDRFYLLAEPFLGKGILGADMTTWKKHRRLLNPAFSQAVLNSFMGIFNSQARRLVKMCGEGLGQPLNHEYLLRINNLQTICLTATGINDHGHLQKQYIKFFAEFMDIVTKRFQQFWLLSDFIFNMTTLKKKQDEIINTMRSLSNQIIEIKKAELRSGSKISTQNNYGNIKPFMDLILDLANETGCFTDKQIADETNTIIAAGHDTSASILTFAFTLLGSHPDIQDKVYKEIQENYENTTIDLDKDNLSKLIYTEAVLKETIRLYPVGFVIERHSDKPVKLKNYTTKANTGFYLIIGAVNRDPKLWGPDAELFKPERWLDAASLPDLSYFGGFGLGRRSCIGKVYAMMSMKVIVAHVLLKYRISADVTKMELMWDVMTRPRGSGHYITLQLRNMEKQYQ